MTEAKRVRPDPVRWVWYAFGGKLPSRHDEWVLHDVTARTWQLRHAVRSLVQISPGLLFLLVPGPMWIKAMAILGGAILAVWYGMAYAEFTCEHRAFKQGYPLGTARRVRKEAAEWMSEQQRARYAALYRTPEQDGSGEQAGS
ncbi:MULTISPECIES: DUF5313 family protein [unclassified Saccharopolyspora]|uniref:DUF5313 family protein n=1 Tax=unclassified Saccharopolyspora TaxID=2646250 RepID=UPI001CD24637|nr:MULTISPECIES: DUF5313 family protein [unclassified Saccharopolyspora]MCA1184829.1 DUF5313 domain-containing protein [Saccharopolyspora sp. 6T]MCA1190554.1 DUF5313 domain-containing protein [Saccharopolyspora sp. 6V]MCA1226423.1 DUF5313 domain-containing protein [Saccharopolyspora sp. 6M]MCA1280870.1 DUF5313 domain-containing protein [Saccharopolyspora sp. 7B]